MLEINKIHNYNCLEGLKLLDDNSVDCCVTSPPYWGLRDYGVKEQLGMEKTPEEYVATMVLVFGEVNRILKPEGTLWLNLGDTYSAHKDCKSVPDTLRVGGRSESANIIEKGQSHSRDTKLLKAGGYKNKDMVGIPWMTAFALRTSGWYLRQDIIWHKPNPMPESVTDRCTKSHEYIFLMSKSQKYYYDYEAIQEPCSDQERTNFTCGTRSNGENTDRNDNDFGVRSKTWSPKTAHKGAITPGQTPQGKALKRMNGEKDDIYTVRNKRDVWTVNTMPYKEAHFATFPEKLIVDMIKAGCPIGGIVLDPFMGAGTTAVVARKLERNFIGFELNPKYIDISDKRLYAELGMFL